MMTSKEIEREAERLRWTRNHITVLDKHIGSKAYLRAEETIKKFESINWFSLAEIETIANQMSKDTGSDSDELSVGYRLACRELIRNIKR